jgi:hypothetical protein
MRRARGRFEDLGTTRHDTIRMAAVALVFGAASLAGAAAVDPTALIAQQRASTKGSVATRPAGPNPMLAFLPAGANPDHEAWGRWLRSQGKAKRASLPLVDATRLVVMGESEPNNSQAAANAVAGFGSAGGSDPAADITGAIAGGAPPSIIGPFAEDNGAIPLANPTGLTSGVTVQASGTIGDGPYGSAGTGTGDFDFFSMSVLAAGDEIVIDVDTPLPFSGDLDPFVAVWDSAGNLLAFNDDDGSTYDSYLAYAVPAAGTYYVSIGAYLSPIPSDPFNPASGPGSASEGTYDVRLGLNSLDSDFFSIGLQAGDVIAANLVAPLGARVSLSDPGGGLRIDSNQDATSIEPGPFPGGGAAVLTYVVETAGTHAIRVRGPVGAYTLELRVFRPALELASAGVVQTVFVDFDGATVDPAIFGAAPGAAVLSPLSAFLAGWGLAPVDESALIDAILAVIEENLSTDMRVLGLNGDFDLSGIPGDFDVVLLNSRDHADPFGDPNVSRLIIGGTIPELTIGTIGIAQSIDPGNFATDESAVVLLDLLSAPASDPNSLNQFGLAGGATKIDLVAAGVGNIAAHEAGHFFANFHTDQFNAAPNIMDQGGNLPNIVGVGGDLTLGTGDDFDVDFGPDAFVPNEGFVGTEDTLNAVAFGLSTGTGAGPCSGTLVPVMPTKLIVLDKLATSSKAKAVFVAKDPGITKGSGTDPANISVEFTAAYANDAASGSFELPAGDAGWLANNGSVAKFVNKLAPGGTSEAKVAIIKPGRLAKLVGKGLGDTAFDIYGAGDPAGDVHTAYCVDNGGDETCHCSTLSGCSYKLIAGGTGAKLVCKLGTGDAGCAAICP